MKPTLKLLMVLLLAECAVGTVNAGELPLTFIKQHCLECHDASTTEGDFRADLLGTDLTDVASHKTWSRVLTRVQSGEMPPPQDTERPAVADQCGALGIEDGVS
jgi:mono/diheme cytochrome c family protein